MLVADVTVAFVIAEIMLTAAASCQYVAWQLPYTVGAHCMMHLAVPKL